MQAYSNEPVNKFKKLQVKTRSYIVVPFSKTTIRSADSLPELV